MPLPQDFAEDVDAPLLPPKETGERSWESETKHTATEQGTRRLLMATLVVCILSIAVNLYLAAPSLASPPPVQRLRRPSTYYGIEKVVREKSVVVPPFVNLPEVLTQVSEKAPDRIYPYDVARWLTVQGVVSPEEKHFFLDSETSSVAQFRIRDYGMEKCAIVAQIPDKAVEAIAANHLRRMKQFTLAGDTTVDVWMLESDDPYVELDPFRLSYTTLPARKSLLGTIEVSENLTSSTASFDCTTGTLKTFEFVCRGRDCLVDFYQGAKAQEVAVFISQSSSL